MNKNEMVKLLRALADVSMPSGFESPQAALIEDFAKSIGYTAWRDALGNLFCRRALSASDQEQSSGRKLMIAAAMDVKGFLTTHVSGDKAWFQAIGPFEKPERLAGMPVRFENGSRGVIESLVSGSDDGKGNGASEEQAAGKEKDVKMEDLFIRLTAQEKQCIGDDAKEKQCIGEAAPEKQSAQKSAVQTGDAAAAEAKVKEMGNDLVQTPHGDHLAGCLAVLDTMERLRDDAAAEDVTFVFLAQHWPGRMGLRAAVKRAAPETCILCGGAEAAEETETESGIKKAEVPEAKKEHQDREEHQDKEKHPIDVEIGSGPVIRFRENLHANDQGTCRKLIRAAEQAGISWQGEARNRDMSGATEAMVSGSRPGVSWLGVPVRKSETAEDIFSIEEVNQCGQVLCRMAELEK